jgi:hypothetical protein
VFYFLLAYAALMAAPSTYYVIQTGLDPSWRYALNFLAGSHYKFGPDVAFTFGPLGFIAFPQNTNFNLPFALLVRFFIWVILITEIESAHRQRRSTRPACFIAVLAIIFAHPLLRDSVDYMLACSALLLLLRQFPARRGFWRITVLLSVLCAVAFLTKESSYVMLMLALAVYYGLGHLRERRIPSREFLIRLVLIVCTPFCAYLLYDRSVPGLWAYVIGAMRIVSGYSTAMSINGLPVREYWQLGMLTAMFLGFSAFALWRKWFEVETAACVMSSFLLGMKHDIVRDGGNLTFIYAFTMVLLAILILECRKAKRVNLVGGSVFAAVCILSLTEMDPVWKTLSGDRWNPAPSAKALGDLLHWNRSMSAAAAQTEANLQEDRLPEELLRRIRGNPVVIFPWELSYAPANHLDLLPLYTLQTYAAYTNQLDLRTAANLANSPPDTKLLMEWKGQDGRHPLLDVPATWETIVSNFAPETTEPGLLLLTKRDHPKVFHFKALARRVTDIRQWQDVPNRDYAVGAAVALSPSVWGALRNILYKTNPIFLELDPDRGSPQRFRVVPDVLKHPFVINCLPLSSAALESVLFENVCSQRIKRFRFSGPGLDSFSSSAEITFTESVDEPLRFGATKDAGLQDTKMPSEIQLSWTGSVDAIDGRPLPGENSAANPLTVPFGKRLEIQGWAASDVKGEAFEGVYAILGVRQMRGVVALRPDVAKYLHNSRLSHSGFQISIDTSAIQRGVYALKLVGVTQNGTVFRWPSQIYVRIE